MLIRNKHSKKTLQEQNLNKKHSTEGKIMNQQATELQASVQGSLSDMVRQSPNGILDDAQVEEWIGNIQKQSPESKAVTTLNPKIVKRYVMRGGKLCQIN